MKNFTILRNGNKVLNGEYNSLADAKKRVETLKRLFKYSDFKIICQNRQAKTSTIQTIAIVLLALIICFAG